MIFSSFCCLTTLQVGCATLSVVYVLISALVIGLNAFDFSHHPLNSLPFPLILLTIFAILMVVAGIIIFACAYSENKSMCGVAVNFLIIVWLYWIILSILSFMNKPSFSRIICHGNRCPETFWLAKFNYKEDKTMSNGGEHNFSSAKIKSFVQKTLKDNLRNENMGKIVSKQLKEFFRKRSIKYISPVEESNGNNHRFTDNDMEVIPLSPVWNVRRKELHDGSLDKDLINDISETDWRSESGATEGEPREVKTSVNYILGNSFLGSICFFVANSMFFGFTILVLCAFSQEIRSKHHLLSTPSSM